MNDSGQKLIFAPLIRVSTERQKNKGESLHTQRRQLESAINILGGKAYKWYSGQEHATPEQERKILGELMKDAVNKRFDAIMVCDLTRWSRDNLRNKKDLAILKENRIRFFTGTYEHDLFNNDQYLNICLNAEFSEHNARNNAQKSLLNRIERAKRGNPTCGQLPHGRKFNEKTGEWEVEKEKKRILEEIARVYLEENIGFEELGQRFGMNGSNLAKILTKRSGDLWEQHFRSKAHNIDVIVLTKVPRLLSDEIIEKIKKKAESRKSYNHGVYKYEYLFNRIIFDADTGYALTATPNSKGKRYYKPYQGSNAHRYMVNADILEKAVLEEFFEVLGCTKSLQEAVFDGNPVGKVAEELKEKLKKLQKKQTPIDRKIENITKAIEVYEGEDFGGFFQKLKPKIKTLEQEKNDLEFQIQVTQNQISTLPTDSEIKTMKDRIRSELLMRQKESYLKSGLAFESLPFSEKKKIILLFFGGKDETGKKYGIYIKLLDGKPRRYGFKVYGKFVFIAGGLEARATNYSSYSRIEPSIENTMLNKELAEIVLNENPDLKVKEHILSIDQGQPLPDSAFLKTFFNLRGNVDKSPAGWNVKP